jgi:nitroreductase
MTRSFTTDPVDPGEVSSIFSGALRAPSAGFAQAVEYLVLISPERRALFWDLIADPAWQESSKTAQGLIRAPVVALCLVDQGRYRERYAAADKSTSILVTENGAQHAVPFAPVDAGFATMIVLLAAEERGLGALFFHLQGRERALLDGLGVPPRFDAIGAVAIGHRGEETTSRSPHRIPRRTDAECIHYEQYEERP